MRRIMQTYCEPFNAWTGPEDIVGEWKKVTAAEELKQEENVKEEGKNMW
jgi:hypothetical protein